MSNLKELLTDAYKAGFRLGLEHYGIISPDGAKLTDDFIDALTVGVENLAAYKNFMEKVGAYDRN